jgi:hypothetical protein
VTQAATPPTVRRLWLGEAAHGAEFMDRFLSVDMAQSAIPEALAAHLRPLLEDGAAQGRTYIDHWLSMPA